MKQNEPSPYYSITEQKHYPVKMQPDGNFYQPNDLNAPIRPLHEVEEKLVRDTSRLISALDGMLDEELAPKEFLEGEPRYKGACDAAIYLDKSARPVRALVNEFWDAFSESEQPKASFLNIDKIDYLFDMGYTMKDLRVRAIEPKELDIEKSMDPKALKLRLAEFRALYLKDTSILPEIEQMLRDVEEGRREPEVLDALWDMPTVLDDKHVAIVDEVRSSAATLAIADQLLRGAIPAARFEPLFWETSSAFRYEAELPDGRRVDRVADRERPLWYDSRTSSGRGGVGNTNPEKARQSTDIKARIGAYVLSRPYTEENGALDTLGIGFRKDFKTLRQRYDQGKVPKPIDMRR